MNSLFRGLVACLAVCVSASAAVSYVVANRSTGLYSIPSGATINSSVGGALDLAVDGGGNYIIATAVAIVRVTPRRSSFDDRNCSIGIAVGLGHIGSFSFEFPFGKFSQRGANAPRRSPQ